MISDTIGAVGRAGRLQLLVVHVRPVLQRRADGVLGLRGPRVVAALAVGVHDLVPRALDQLLGGDLGARRDGLHVLHDLLAEDVERQVVDVVAEGVLDLVADEEDAEDDVRREDGRRDRDPPERGVQLEGQQGHVEPGDLGDDDGVGDGEGGVQDTLRVHEYVVEETKVIVYGDKSARVSCRCRAGILGVSLTNGSLLHSDRELAVGDKLVDVGRQVAENL